jgi:hypothetical protein
MKKAEALLHLANAVDCITQDELGQSIVRLMLTAVGESGALKRIQILCYDGQP